MHTNTWDPAFTPNNVNRTLTMNMQLMEQNTGLRKQLSAKTEKRGPAIMKKKKVATPMV